MAELAGKTPRRLLRVPEVTSLIGLRRTTLYKLISRGEFPAPVHLTERAVAWPSDQVQAWIDAKCGEEKA